MKYYFMAILFLYSFSNIAQESNLGEAYFGNFLQPEENLLIKIKPDNKFQIVSVSSAPNRVSETMLAFGAYLLKNDTLILQYSEQESDRFKILQNLALKPLIKTVIQLLNGFC